MKNSRCRYGSASGIPAAGTTLGASSGLANNGRVTQLIITAMFCGGKKGTTVRHSTKGMPNRRSRNYFALGCEFNYSVAARSRMS
ncbi:hypothetical protein ACFQ7J_33510, partial [Streptomyces sp. NPDC056501]|uniref:hypothetical protein n=1 Tax=Streptomyces sp. NPDC056501 TaxID=3345841 RepID=UPI0036A3BBAE